MATYEITCGIVNNPVCPADKPAPLPVIAGDGVVLDKPNIVVVQFDDMGFADLQMMGFGLARTPWLNRISREGLTAERYFTGSTVCSPSRYSMATGRDSAEDGVFTTIKPDAVSNAEYNNIHGIPINVPTIYGELKNQLGYKTAHHGKWHMGLDPALMDQFGYGLDEYSGWAFHNPATPNPDDRALQLSDRLAWEQTRDQLMTDRTCAFIETHANNDPFFVNVSYHSPHFPLYPSDEGLAAVAHLDGSDFFNTLDPDDERRPAAQRYYASIWDTDKKIGEIYQCLNRNGILDDTIFIITSDNGPLTNRNHTASPDQWGRVGSFRGMKGTTYNGGIRVPFIARGPRIPAGYVPEKATLSALDVMPTLLHMAGGIPPADVDGEVMTAQWQGQDVDRTKILHWLTIQNLPISMHVADRSPVIRGYYPAQTVGNNNPMNVYTNEIGSQWGKRFEIYRNDDQPEIDNVFYQMVRTCGSLRRDLIHENHAWYVSLDNPRLKVNAGRLEHRL